MKHKHSKIHDGTRDLITFDNGYAASIVRHQYSYGGREGLFEVAVEYDGKLTYDTPITGDVLGYLTFREVADVMDKIAALPDKNEFDYVCPACHRDDHLFTIEAFLVRRDVLVSSKGVDKDHMPSPSRDDQRTIGVGCSYCTWRVVDTSAESGVSDEWIMSMLKIEGEI